MDSEFDAFHSLPAVFFELCSLGLGLMSASDAFWKRYKDTIPHPSFSFLFELCARY